MSLATRHTVLVGLRLGTGLNAREHHYARSRRVKHEREVTAWALHAHERRVGKPALPCLIRLERQGPSNGLDGDNLQGSLKGVRDEVAAWLGADDGDEDLVRFAYSQKRADEWRVLIVTETVKA